MKTYKQRLAELEKIVADLVLQKYPTLEYYNFMHPNGPGFQTPDMIRPDFNKKPYTVVSYCEDKSAKPTNRCKAQLKLIESLPKKQWEILEFKATGKTARLTLGYIKRKDGKFSHPGNGHEIGFWSEENIIHMTGGILGGVIEGSYSIHSVRRTSDNAIFMVGDKVKHSLTKEVATITHFTILGDDNMTVTFDTPGHYLLDSLLKPLFTTADGHHAFIGDNIFWVMRGSGRRIIGEIHARKVTKDCNPICWPDAYKYREAAQAFLGGHLKPVFTTSDGIDLFSLNDKVWTHKGMFSVDYAIDRPDEYYSTSEAAKKNYERWLINEPCISLQDIMNTTGCAYDTHKSLLSLVKQRLSK